MKSCYCSPLPTGCSIRTSYLTAKTRVRAKLGEAIHLAHSATRDQSRACSSEALPASMLPTIKSSIGARQAKASKVCCRQHLGKRLDTQSTHTLLLCPSQPAFLHPPSNDILASGSSKGPPRVSPASFSGLQCVSGSK